MPKPKKLTVEIAKLSETFLALQGQGYNMMKIELPKQNPALPWQEHRAQIRAWRSVRRKSLEDKD
jgi:hypothetical protein